jgi:hypothetical protein
LDFKCFACHHEDENHSEFIGVNSIIEMDGVTSPTTTHQTLKGRIGDPHFALGYIGHGHGFLSFGLIIHMCFSNQKNGKKIALEGYKRKISPNSTPTI